MTSTAGDTSDHATRLIAAVRAIAHPVRIRIYDFLVTSGPQTVSAVAKDVDVAVGSASYHLLQLAESGYVTQVTPKTGEDRRERWWQVSSGGLEWNPADLLHVAGGRELSTAAHRLLVERRVEKMAAWVSQWHTWSSRWVEAAEDSDTYLELTPEELEEVSSEIHEVLDRWRKQSQVEASPSATSDRERVFVALSAFPVRTKVSGGQ